MSGDRRGRRWFVGTVGTALVGGLAGCSGESDDETSASTDTGTTGSTPTPTTTTTTEERTTDPTTTDEQLSLPFERTLSEDHPLVRWTIAREALDDYRLFAPAYENYMSVRERLEDFAGELQAGWEYRLESQKRFFNLDRGQVDHHLTYGEGPSEVLLGSFDQETVVDRLKERANDRGTRRGYRVFRRFTDRLQYPYLIGVKDGVLLLAGGKLGADEQRWFNYLADAGAGAAPRHLLENEYARQAYAPFGDIDMVRLDTYSAQEARNGEAPDEGLRMWTYGFEWSTDQVRMKSVMVYEEPEDTNPEGVRVYLDEHEPAKHYDFEVSSAGQVVYFDGTAPMETFDTFSRGDPGTEEDWEQPGAADPDELPPVPEDTRWTYETDYDAGETTVNYQFGPEVTNVRLLGVALNNTRLYETQFRTEYDRPIRPGDSITVETPPEQAGEDVTVSWLSGEPYFVLDAYTLPTLDEA